MRAPPPPPSSSACHLPRDTPEAGASIFPLLCLPNRIPVSMRPTHGIPTRPHPVCQQNRATDEAVTRNHSRVHSLPHTNKSGSAQVRSRLARLFRTVLSWQVTPRAFSFPAAASSRDLLATAPLSPRSVAHSPGEARVQTVVPMLSERGECL